MVDACQEPGCERDAEYEFYRPETGQVELVCRDHLAAANELIEVRSWLLAGYARPVEDAGRQSLPKTPRRPEERQAREAVDQLVRRR